MSYYTNVAYLAGYFDGEGAVMVKVIQRLTKKSVTVNIAASQKRGTGLERFVKQFGGHIYGPFKGDVYMWKANGEVAVNCLIIMLPYLTVKRPKAEEAIELWRNYH